MENFGAFIAGMGSLFFLLIAWSGIWKGIALWKAARNNHLGWFIALCVINTLGILEILYIFIWGKKPAPGESALGGKDTTPPTTPPTA